ncbi:MAG: hypothetical protein JO011_12115 [Ktedonobacteraceae bacterium]|nr:hypothetical protein [Ktedonobacteraceae bacterium]
MVVDLSVRQASCSVSAGAEAYLFSVMSKNGEFNAENEAATNLSPDFEGTCMDWLNSDIGDEHMVDQSSVSLYTTFTK